jgi:hypothetical protein
MPTPQTAYLVLVAASFAAFILVLASTTIYLGLGRKDQAED